MCVGCARSFSLDDEPIALVPDAANSDAATLDGGIDEPVECAPYEFVGCSFVTAQWVWNGSNCEVAVDCDGLGFESRRACIEAHTECGATCPCGPDAREPVDCADPQNWTWNGSSCEQTICCEGPVCPGFETRAECVAEYTSCGAEVACGPDLMEGVNLIAPERLSERAAESCITTPGDDWLARGVFTAPRAGTYEISSYPRIAWPHPINIAILDGRCTDTLLECGNTMMTREFEAGETVTIMTKAGYDDEPPSFFGGMEINIREL